MDLFFLVWNSSKAVSSSNYRHESRKSAEQEAERLASANPGEYFYVLAAIGMCHARTVDWDRVPSGEIPF